MSDAPPKPVSNRGTEARAAGLRVAREVLATESAALAKLAENMDEAAMSAALDRLLACAGRIVCTGMGKSGIIAKKLAGTLASTGSPAFFLHPAEAGHGDLGMIVDDDVVIALSHSGETREIVELLPAVRRLEVQLVAMVGERDSTLAREADVMLHVDIDEEACPLGLAPTASTTAALALGDALAMALLKERGFGAEDFAGFHPRGALGRRLLRVRDVMHVGTAVPTVTSEVPIAAAVAEMSAKGLGMTTVVDADDRLLGILTDGDLRRLLQARVSLDTPVEERMTADPVRVRPDALATEALRLLEERKITALVVEDDAGGVAGVVHLHDLWRTQMI